MTAPVPSSYSPVTAVKNGATSKAGTNFTVDQNFLQNQTIKGASDVRLMVFVHWLQIFMFAHYLLFESIITVYVRLKPQEGGNDDDNKKKSKEKKVWGIQKTGIHDTLVQKGVLLPTEGKSMFHFDQVFDEEAQTPLLYKSIARSMVHTVVGGKHATIFAYGQTGAGYVGMIGWRIFQRYFQLTSCCCGFSQENIYNAGRWPGSKWTSGGHSACCIRLVSFFENGGKQFTRL
jgi:hypothetical protein